MSDTNLQRYADFFQSLSPDSLGRLADVMTEDVRFVDPFNDVTGHDKVRLVFEHMFRHLDAPKFTVTHAAMVPAPAMKTGAAPAALLRWKLSAFLKRNHKPWDIVGMSEVHFAADGRICKHVDHWDAGQQFYERLPIIGWLLRRIRASLRV